MAFYPKEKQAYDGVTFKQWRQWGSWHPQKFKTPGDMDCQFIPSVSAQ